MPTQQLYRDYPYVGELAHVISLYIAEKRAVGALFNTEAKSLYRFSRFSLDYPLPKDTLTEELAKAWIERQPDEKDKTLHQRYSTVKGLAEYMHRMGYSAYRPLTGDLPRLSLKDFTPYIFTYSEVLRFFAALDSDEGRIMRGKRVRRMYRVVFRLLYCCGLRVSEAVALTNEDILWNENLLAIRDSKFGKSRYVPMSDEMTKILKSYTDTNHYDTYLFSASGDRPLFEGSVYSYYRKVLFKAGISHGGRGKGPRLHDFRHTFSVHCLQRWVRLGTPLSSALPRLSTYLGHVDMAATEKYLRLTAEAYPEISETLSREYGNLIPKEAFAANENYASENY